DGLPRRSVSSAQQRYAERADFPACVAAADHRVVVHDLPRGLRVGSVEDDQAGLGRSQRAAGQDGLGIGEQALEPPGKPGPEGRWDRAVTLLVAGPGFGKTTVLAQAVRAHQVAPRGIAVWVSCEAAYEDPACFARALLGAISAGRGSSGPGRRTAPGSRDVVD